MDPLKLARAGYAVFPCHPKTKAPRLKDVDWKKVATSDLATVRRWWKQWPDSLIGLPTGRANGIAVLDLDLKDGKDGLKSLRKLGLDEVAESPVEIETRSGGLHRYFAYVDGVRNQGGKLGPGIDVRGEGGYVIAWDEGEALLDDAVGLPPFPEDLIPEAPERDAAPIEPVGLTVDEAQEVLDRLDLDEWCEDREGWLRVGMALHAEFGEEGRELWDDFSAQSGKFDEGGQEKAWNSFGNRPGGVTMRTLMQAAEWFKELDGAALFAEVEPDEDEEDDEPEIEEEGTQLERRAKRQALVLNEVHGLVLTGGQCLVIRDDRPHIEFFKSDQLSKWYSNRKLTTLTPAGQETLKPISDVWLGAKGRRSYEGVEFHPGKPPSSKKDKGTRPFYNLWRGWAVRPDPEASCKLFLRHLLRVICKGDREVFEWAVQWLAHMVQRPEEKPGTAWVIKGRRGTGKDLVAAYVGRMMNPTHYVTVAQPKHVTGNFNNHMASCLLLHIEEGVWSGDRQAEQVLKHIITTPTLMIEKKGIDAIPVRSCLRIIETSNERWTVPAGENERRYFVCEVSDEFLQDPNYFDPLWAELEGDGPAALLHYLMGVDLTGFNVRKPLHTAALIEEQIQGLRGVAWWWNRVIESERLPGGFDDPWPESVDRDLLYDHYCEALREARFKGEVVSIRWFVREMADFGVGCKRSGRNGADRVMLVPDTQAARRLFLKRLK